MNKPVSQLELIPAVGIEPPLHPTKDDGTRDFDWSTDKADICIERQPRTAVYENISGAVLIRQENDHDTDDDVVVIRPDNLPALIKALQRYLP